MRHSAALVVGCHDVGNARRGSSDDSRWAGRREPCSPDRSPNRSPDRSLWSVPPASPHISIRHDIIISTAAELGIFFPPASGEDQRVTVQSACAFDVQPPLPPLGLTAVPSISLTTQGGHTPRGTPTDPPPPWPLMVGPLLCMGSKWQCGVNIGWAGARST